MATKSVTVNVRKKHWDAALKRVRLVGGVELQIDAGQCPIAQALRDKFEGYFVNVYPDKVYLGLAGSNSPTFKLDKAGKALVKTFDSHEMDSDDIVDAKMQFPPTLPKGKRMPEFPVKVKLTCI